PNRFMITVLFAVEALVMERLFAKKLSEAALVMVIVLPLPPPVPRFQTMNTFDPFAGKPPDQRLGVIRSWVKVDVSAPSFQNTFPASETRLRHRKATTVSRMPKVFRISP